MVASRSRLSVALTLLVGLTTLCELALPDGPGERDSVVRLTRAVSHRAGRPDAIGHDHDEADGWVTPDAVPHDGAEGDAPAPAPAALAAGLRLLSAPLVAITTAPSFDGAPPPPAPPAHAAAGRAPPAR